MEDLAELKKCIGGRVRIEARTTMEVDCTIIDVRVAKGEARFRIKPKEGIGTAWVSEDQFVYWEETNAAFESRIAQLMEVAQSKVVQPKGLATK